MKRSKEPGGTREKLPVGREGLVTGHVSRRDGGEHNKRLTAWDRSTWGRRDGWTAVRFPLQGKISRSW